MITQLTLEIDKNIVERAESVSRRKGKSLNKMIEEYLRAISEEETDQGKSAIDRIHTILRPYQDKLNLLQQGGDYRNQVREWQYQDYMPTKKKNEH